MAQINEFAKLLAQEAARQTVRAAAKAAAGAAPAVKTQASPTAPVKTAPRTAQAAQSAARGAAAAAGVKAAPAAYYSPNKLGSELETRETDVRRSRLRMELAAPKLAIRQKMLEEAYAAMEQTRQKYYQTKGQFRGESAAKYEKQMLDDWTAATKAYQEEAAAYQAEYDAYKPREDRYNASVKGYNDYVASQQEEYNQWRGSIRSIDEIKAEQARYRDAEAELERLMKEQNELTISAGLDRTVAAPAVYDANRAAQLQERIRELQEYMGSGGEKRRLLQEELEWAEYYKYDDVRTAADFTEKSAYRSSADGSQTRIDPLSGAVYGSRFADPLYDYVNRNGAAVMEQGHNNRLNDMSYVEVMNDDEIGIFNYLYATQGSQRARDYLSEIRTRLTARQMGQTQNTVAEMATQNGFLGALTASAISVGLSPISGFQSTVGQLGSVLTGREIDPNASYNLATNTKNAIRQAVGGKVEENFGPVGSFFYDTGMSMLDMLMDRHVAGGLTGGQGVLKLADGTEQVVNLAADGAKIKAAVDAGATLNAYASPAVMTIMSSRAFSESVIDAKNRGLSDGQALTMGLTSALAEVVTERVGLDELGKLSNEDAARSLLGRIWKGAVGEGLEEGMTSVINFAADQIITGKESQFWQNVRAFQEEGYTDTGAFVKAMGIAAGQVGIDMLGGMVSGGVFGAADRSGTEGRKKTDPAKSDLSPTNAADKNMTQARGEERLTLEKAREIAINRVNPLVTGVAHTAESRAKLERIEKAETLAEVTGVDLGVDEERIQSAVRLSKLLGKDIVFYSAAATKNGVEYGHYQRSADQIAINAQSPQVIAATIGHELTHSVELAESYESLRNLVKGRLKGTELDAMRGSIRALYEKNGVKLSDEALDREVVAKYVERHLLTDEESIRQMVEDDRNVAQRVLDWLDGLWAKISRTEASQEREFVRRARYLYRTALEEAQGKRQRLADGERTVDDWLAPLDDDAGEYSFGGVNARAADRQALEEAKKMAEAGISAKTIFRKTGWYQGADGKWRFEIDDSKLRYDKTGNLRGAESGKELLKDVVPARKALEQAADDETMEKVRAYDVALIVKNEAKQKALYGELSTGEFGKEFQRYAAAKNAVFDSAKNDFGGRLADYIDHPALFEQYPKLQDMWLIFRDLSEEGAEGYFDGVNLVLDESLRDAPESTMLHEIQHAIQKAEGFAGGSNPEYWAAVQGGDQALMKSSDGTKLARKRAMRALMDLPGAIARSDQVAAAEELGIAVHTAKKFADGTDARRDPFELYDNTAGEIEARDVSRRRNMSAEQRKKRLPDTGDGNTVFVEDGAGRSYSIGPDMTEDERYEELQQVVVPVAEIDYDAISDVDLSEYNTRKKSAVIPGFKRLAQQLGIVNVDLRNSEISFPFRFTNRNLEKSLHHQLEYGGTYQDYVKAMSCFNEIVSNAALIEVHRDKKAGTAKENRDLLRTYVLVGAYRDDGKIVPVQLEVKEFRERGDSLYMNVVLTKIEPEVVDAGIPGNSGDVPHLVSSSMISLRHLLTNVKAADGRFLKYVPDQFLNEAQLAAKDDALRRQREEYQGYGKRQYSFGGVGAQATDRQALEEAKALARAGADARTIFQKTGWYQGADGKWRFEIDDSGMKYRRSGDARFRQDHPEYARYQELEGKFIKGTISEGEIAEMQSLKNVWSSERHRLAERVARGNAILANVLEHDALFEAYPQLRRVRVRFGDTGSAGGWWDKGRNEIVLSDNYRNADAGFLEGKLLHEIQHAIQDIEGFAGGSNPEYWEEIQRGSKPIRKHDRELERAYRDAETALKSVPPEVQKDFWYAANMVETDPEGALALQDKLAESEYADAFDDYAWEIGTIQELEADNPVRGARDLYLNTAGEIEARDAARRQHLNAGARKNRLPDTGGEDTVFVDGDTSQYSIGDGDTGFEEHDIISAVYAIRYEKPERGRDLVRIGTMPRLYRDLFGLSGDVFVSNSHLYQNLVSRSVAEDEGRYNGDAKADYHDLGEEKIINAIDQFQDPLAIMESLKDYNEPRLVAILDEKGNDGKNLVAVLELYTPLRAHGSGRLRNHVLITVYEKNALPDYVSKTIEKGRILYKKEGLHRSSQADLRLVGEMTDEVLKKNVARFNKKVKQFRERNGISYSIGAVSDDDAELAVMIDADEEPAAVAKTAIPEGGADPEKLRGQALDQYRRVQRTIVNSVAKALQVPYHAKREFLAPIAERLAGEYLRVGTISQETRDELFEAGWKHSRVEEQEFYDTYKDVKDFLRDTAVTISEADRWRDFAEFRRQAFGTLKIVNEGGTPVDSLWEELRHMAPELFPEDVYNVEDQLKAMYDIGRSIRKAERNLEDFYGPEAEKWKELERADFEAGLLDAIQELWKVRRLAAERQAEELAVTAPEDVDGESPAQMTVQEVMELWPKVKDARRNAEKVMAKQLLTKADKEKVRRLMAHDIQPEHLDPTTDNVEGIMAVYEAKWLYEQAAEPIRKWNRQRKAQNYAQAERIISDAGEITDKKLGLGYSIQTMERNIRDIVKNPEAAEKIIQTYFAPVHTAQAKANGMMKEYRERVRRLELSRKIKKGDQVSESYAVQFYGEVSDILRVIDESEGRIKERDGKMALEWQAELNALWENNPGLDQKKVEAAAAEFGKIYEELFQKMNEARVANGYEPINHRSGYFPHFQQDGRDGILGRFGKGLGIEVETQPLPTTINGLTHTFKPGIRWFANALERKGFQTAYDAVEGFDRYIEGVADVVHHTENIQRLRALANRLRYRTGDEGLREQIRKIQARTDLNDEEKNAMIKAKWENGRYELSNFVVELDEYTNLLANKKSRADRNMEQAIGRNAYNVVKSLEGRVAANMVAINPASWLTNFIPLTQGWACLDTKHLLSGMWQTLRANKTGDGIADASVFLTNRQGSERLVQSGVKEWSRKRKGLMKWVGKYVDGSIMEWIDGFTSGSLVRARYRQNLSRGMSEAQAMADADEWTAGVMADRSKGAMPTLFYRSNPVTKLFTQFQLEVANQYGYLFKDIPRQKREEHIKNLAWALLKFALGAWIYNNLYESFLGRRPALDPIELLLDTGEGLIDAFDPDEDTDLYDVGSALIGDVLEQTPFIGGLLGGGRVPISSALPDAENLGKALFSDDWDAEKRWQTGWKEIAKPGLYILPPFGGGQIKKIWEALAMIKDGGSYTLDKDGNPQLQYVLYSTDSGIQQALELGQAMFFGKTTIKSGREWVNGGFGSLSAEQTAAYQALIGMGMRQREAYDLLTELRYTEKTDEKSRAQLQREALRFFGLNGERLAVVYYDLLATDKETALMDELRLTGADMGEVTRAIMDMKDADAMYNGAAASNAKRDAIMAADLSDEQKAALYREMISDSWADEIQAFADVGLDMDAFLWAQNVHASIKEQYEDEGDMATAFARWCNWQEQGFNDAQKQVIRESLKYWQMMPAQADRYDRAISEGLSDAEAYKLAEGLDALEPPEDKTQVQDVQKWRVAIDQAPELEDQLQWLRSAGLSGTTYDKVETGWEMGLPPAAWVRAKEVTSQYDTNGNGSLNQAEIKALIDGITTFSVVPEEGKYHLSQKQKAVLWQMLVGKNTKATNNPYSASEGQRWREAMGYE